MTGGTAPYLPSLGKRGQTRLDQLNIPSPFPTIEGKYYDAESCPEGTINLGTAENSLLSEHVLNHMHQHFHMTRSHLKYRMSIQRSSIPSTIDALPLFINRYAKPIEPVMPAHVVPGPGIGALVAQLVWHLCDEGDGVLLSTPYYDDYRRDIEHPSRAKVVAARIPADINPLSTDSIAYLRETALQSNAEGTRIRALILCNPHNPLARAYPLDTIVAFASLAEELDIHLIVDEVFANEVFASSFSSDPTPFISILSLDILALSGCNPARIHVLGGPTKDFGASGVKVGAYISQYNPGMVKLMRAGLAPTPISSAADTLFTAIINDEDFFFWFLEENRRRLGQAFELVGTWCQFHHLPFEIAEAGVFFLIDFASLLDKVLSDPGAPLEEKHRAAGEAMLKHKVYLRPSTASEDSIPTRYRMVFSLPSETMLLALRRLEDAFDLPYWNGNT